MTKQREKWIHVKDCAFIIEEAIKRLPRGESRLWVSSYPLSHACLSRFNVPDITERIESNYGMPSENVDIEREFHEEIKTIEKIMDEKDIPIPLADWQSRAKISKYDSAIKMHKSLNRRSYAIRLWDWYGIPWRYNKGGIHLIWSPEDIMGSPIIHSYRVEDFLTYLTITHESQAKDFLATEKKLNFWKFFGTIVGFIVIILLLMLIF